MPCADGFHVAPLLCVSCLQHPRHWQAASQEAFGPCHKDVVCCSEHVRQLFRWVAPQPELLVIRVVMQAVLQPYGRDGILALLLMHGRPT